MTDSAATRCGATFCADIQVCTVLNSSGCNWSAALASLRESGAHGPRGAARNERPDELWEKRVPTMDVKQMMTKNETSAEYWGDLISDCLIHLNDEYESHVGGDRLADLTGWLHEDGNGGEGHWFETAPCYCLHVFAD